MTDLVRIFISSPSDVAEERDRARQVVDGLRKRYAGCLRLETVLWEELPLTADMSFQDGIDLILSKGHGIDIALFILWSRLGSPLGGRIRKPDGSEYRSGTEHEFDLMLAAYEQSGRRRPQILASYLGTMSWYCVLSRQYTEAVKAAEEGLRIEPYRTWIRTNLAHGYLLLGEFERAKEIYLKYKDEKLSEVGGKTFRDMVLEDFSVLEKAGIRSPEIERIRKLLEDQTPKP